MNISESKYFNTARKMNLALLSLLKRKSFEYITVSEICKTAEVNRSTFYLHYENTADLLEETTKYILDNFMAYFKTDTKSVVEKVNRELNELCFINDSYLMPYLTYIKENKEIFLTALLHMKDFNFESVYEQMFESVFAPILERFRYPEKDRKYVMLYYLNGITAISMEWVKDNCKRPTEEISGIIKRCVYGLDNAVKRKNDECFEKDT